MRLFDTHAHLNMKPLRAQVDSVVERAAGAGVEHIICVGTDLASSRVAIELARRFSDRVLAAVGIHPTATARVSDGALDELERMAGRPDVVAVGETGLDYHHDDSPPEVQQDFFAEHLELARRVEKPVIIHARKADEDTLDVLDSVGTPVMGLSSWNR